MYAQTNTIPGTGNVGIGTTSPTNHLQIGSVGNTGYSGNAIAIGDGTNVIALHYGTNGYLVANGNLALGGNTNFSNQLFLSGGGNVGIGTNTPASKLSIAGGDLQVENGQGRFKGWYNYPTGSGRAVEVGISSGIGYIYNFDRTTITEGDLNMGGAVKGGLTIKANTGDVGLGTTTPAANLHIKGSSPLLATQWLTLIDPQGNSGTGSSILLGQSAGVSAIQGGANTDITIQPIGGNVAIGTTDARGYKLAVKGNAIAESMTVKLHCSWPDYVFGPAYQLPSLTDLKYYIDKNKHLPDMPNQTEVEKNGINLGEVVKIQTQKIEELTLYMIEKDKQVKEQATRIEKLEASLSKLIAKNQ